ncbi:MAG: right-handed parallel beta-helix repeat-containing protein [Prosthecobacter sp.]|nr:right-handed parallel beta-helix repeat-containing protein [Prosthecobacter sp.]
MPRFLPVFLLLFILLVRPTLHAEDKPAVPQELSAANYPSIQAALDANPGRVIHIPAGDHIISAKISLRTPGCGLRGPGRIIQTNPEAPIIAIENIQGARLSELTLTRPEGKQDTRNEAVVAIKCRDLWLDRLQVIDNRTISGAIAIRESTGTRIRDCLVRNYMRISVDDRTASDAYGYAFKCIDGTGISVSYSPGTLIQGNRVIEENLLPTPEIQQKFDLGKFVKKNAVKGSLMSQKVWDAERVDNWHQGSAIIVTAPEISDAVQILGNSIENAAQGIDIHSDHVIIQGNIINNAFIGMKAMHGSRHVLIIGNQFIKNDLWSIGLMPGAASHPALPAADGKPAVPPNVDGGSIIANNIISEFGHGHAHWIWGDHGNPLRFENGQMPDDPPLTDVIIQGNIIYNTGRDEAAEADRVPRFRHAVRISAGVQGLHFSNNLFHAGKEAISNIPLPP